MSASVSLVLLLELKYCERCGALCLREKGDLGVYCRSCEAALRDLPLSIDLGRRA
jgi:hypothetical protein